MTNKQAFEIVVELAKLGDEIAQTYGMNGKRLTDEQRDNNPEAIRIVEDYMDYDDNIRED